MQDGGRTPYWKCCAKSVAKRAAATYVLVRLSVTQTQLNSLNEEICLETEAI